MDRRKRRRLLSALQSGILEDIRSISNTALATFDGDGRDLVRFVVAIDPVQTGSGDPSPDNVRPITGWTECKVTRTGKNLVHVTAVTGIANQVTFTNNGDGTITVDGTATAFAGKALSATASDTLLLKAGVTYHLSGGGNGVNFYLYKIGLGVLRTDSGGGANYTPSKDIDNVVPYLSVSSGVSVNNLVVKPMVEIGNGGTAWEAYQGQTYTIDLDGTRYGGTLDVTSGKLTVTHKYIGVRQLTGPWTKSTTYPGGFYTGASVNGFKVSIPFICSHAATVLSVSDYSQGTCLCDNSLNFRIMPAGSSVQDWLDYLDAQIANDTPVTMCGELQTPIEVDLTPTQITTLSGTNNIWADTGDIILLEYMA